MIILFISSLHCEDFDDYHRIRNLFTLIKANYAPIKGPDLDGNLERMVIQWSPPAMIKNLFKQFNKGQKYALAHNPISDATLIRMTIQNFLAYNFLSTALKRWVIQSILTTFTQLMKEMLKAAAYQQETSGMIGTTGYNVANVISGDSYFLPSLAPTTESELTEATSVRTISNTANIDHINVNLAAIINQ